MSVQLELLRHGVTELGGGLRGSIDDALTAEGWAQLRGAVADGSRWDCVVSSPLQRCARFAEELASQHGVPLTLEADLQELHFGQWEGMTSAQLMRSDAVALGQFWADPYAFTPPGAEPLRAFEARVLGVVQRLQQRYTGQRVLVVTHGGVIRLLLTRARGLPAGDLLQVAVAHAQRFVLSCDAAGQLQELP